MIKFKFPKKRDIRVFEEVHNRSSAQEKAEEAKDGLLADIAHMFSKKKSEWTLSEYFLRYEPIWHVVGESFFEYMRRNTYQIEVKPEVREVTINRSVVKVSDEKPLVVIDGDEHCFEKYSEDVSANAWEPMKEKDVLKPYSDAKAKRVKRINALMKKDTDVVPIETRASLLVSEMLKNLLKPIQADKIINQTIGIKKLTLYFKPVHVFNYTNPDGKLKTILVDAVTGGVSKPSALVQKLKGAKPTEDTFFDIGGGLADSIIPGAGLGIFVGKKIRDYRKKKKVKRAMESSKKAAGG